jgi:hypothetical protein
VRRFFGFVCARPLSPSEQQTVAGYLTPPERPLFWAQAPADQRHAYDTMRRAARHHDDPRVLRAALLHDVGKGVVRLGAVGRSLATVLDALRLPLRGRFARYRNHGPLGADLLTVTGADALIVDFARRHPDPDPGSNDPAEWSVLLDADHV